MQPPIVAFDPFDPTVKSDPYQYYAELRNTAPVVHTVLDGRDVYAVTRYDDVAAGLADHARFSAADGLGLHPLDRFTAGVIVAADPPDHTRIRKVLGRHMSAQALRDWEPVVQATADKLTADLVGRRTFDVTADLARPYTTTVVSDFAGLPQRGREQFPEWAAITINLNGPRTPQAADGLRQLAGMSAYLQTLAEQQDLHPDRLGRRIYEAADAGVISVEEATNLLWGALIVAGLHSSVAFFGHLMLALAQFPDQWDQVRAQPDLMPTLVDEVIRYDTPIPQFFRTARAHTSVQGYDIPGGSRVMLMYGSANHDPRRWDAPDTVDVHRYQRTPDREHVGFGAGNHSCLGAPLLRTEAVCLLRGLAAHGVTGVRQAGGAQLDDNSMIRGYRTLPVALEFS